MLVCRLHLPKMMSNADLKCSTDDADLSSSGKLFHSMAPLYLNDFSLFQYVFGYIYFITLTVSSSST